VKTRWLDPELRQLQARSVHIPRSSLADPVLTKPDRDWRLERDYRYQDRDTQIMVPAGFRFDLASVPRIFWPLSAPFELSIVGPLLHDYAYRTGGRMQTDPPREYTRADADRVFYEAMGLEGVPRWRAVPAWAAVRLFGRPAWRA
jgi:Protein of unknown function (DUF1353)